MARPLSPEKREALLVSATSMIALMGTSAPTSKIAKGAGVSEGTLFIYFETKDVLLNQLFLEIEGHLASFLLEDFPQPFPGREKLEEVWNRIIGWGLAYPLERKAMRQLKVSDRITNTSKRQCETMLSKARAVVTECLAGHADPQKIDFYIDTVLFPLVDNAIDAIAATPRKKKEIAAATFDLFWKGTAA
ncbi:TetR/AcrR family transcriptional regulator [Agrobacterium sp. 16-172Ci]